MHFPECLTYLAFHLHIMAFDKKIAHTSYKTTAEGGELKLRLKHSLSAKTKAAYLITSS